MTAFLFVFGSLVFLSNDPDINENIEFEYPDFPSATIPDVDVFEKNQGFYIENKGQWDEDILFLASTSFGHIGLGKDSVFFDVRDIKEIERRPKNDFEMIDPMMEELPPELEITGHVVKYKFENARDIEPIGVDKLTQTNSYFIGNDSTKWASGVKTFRSVKYPELYDRIDLNYYFNEEGPKYDFILNPGAEVDDIKIRVEGHESLKIDNNSMSVLLPNGKSISDTGLISFYDDRKAPVIRTDFDLINDDTLKFELDEYDPTKKVIIDPLIFCTYIGTDVNDPAIHFQIGRNERIYILGSTISDSFPTSPGAYDRSHHGMQDYVAFIMDRHATEILNSTYIGGTNNDWPGSLFLDDSENFIITGYSNSINFPTTSGAFQESHGGNQDLVFLKLSNDCTDLVYSTYIGGSAGDSGGFYIEPNGDVFISGATSSLNFPTTTGAFDETYNGNPQDCFMMKFENNGTDIVFSTYIGGSDWDYSGGIKLDDQGNIVTCSLTGSADFPTTTGAFDRMLGGGRDGYVLKLKSDGSDLIFSTFVGGSNMDNAQGFDMNENGDIIVVGVTASPDFPNTTCAYDQTFNGDRDLIEKRWFRCSIIYIHWW
jgi:hypothetical protein